MPVGDLPRWRQVFTDDFRVNLFRGNFRHTASNRWHVYPDGWLDTSKHGVYTPSRVLSVHDGVMDFHLHTALGVHRVAAVLPALPTMLYGRYVLRFRADPIPGYRFVSLLWPDSEVWPRDGEINFPEGDLNTTIWGFVHHQDGQHGGDLDAFPTDKGFGSWHTAVIERRPGEVRFILDGVTIGRSTNRIPNTPMHWVLQAETTLDGPPPADATAGHILIDWVAAYGVK
jgi:hypothetical protein